MKRIIFSILLFLLLIDCRKVQDVPKMQTLITKQSNNSFEETVKKLEAAITEKGLKLMAKIDHSENAKKGADLELRPTLLFIFGKPKVGTPLMQAAQTIAIDLPQKALVYEDAAGKVLVSYNDPRYLRERHDARGKEELLAKVSGVLAALADAATSE